ncbi:nucleotidyltransferase domain-containing protein [Bacillus sp. CGMCC 1.16607]|uniref:nucleotidyltransferase domain-containing protein n=1 Tax=Bacillus sp. CGMCC 1.16607 TaxID=3351842 RepID=UPI00362B40A7
MLPQESAVEKIANSLKEDPKVQAIFLKGSMGRNEHDEHSDVDLYCLVDKVDEELFLSKRLKHLQAYRPIIFHDEIHIIAPQIIAVFDNFLHIDLFTVTKESFTEKDYIKVLYDPYQLLNSFIDSQGLTLSKMEFRDDVSDVAWFLFQYKKAAARGNDIWSVRMLTNVMYHFARALLYRYAPDRAQLGLKTVEQSLPKHIVVQMNKIFEHVTPYHHQQAVYLICLLVSEELDWINQNLIQGDQIKLLLEKMLHLRD